MLGVDFWALFDDVNHGHTVASSEVILRLQPLENLTGFNLWIIKALFLSLDQNLPGGKPCFFFNCIKIRLERHCSSSSVLVG